MGNISNILGGAFKVETAKSPEVQLYQAMINKDFDPPTSLILDGEIHRFGNKKNSWYVAFGDNVPAGIFGNWQTGEQHSWCGNIGRTLTLQESIENSKRLEELKKIREEKLKVKHEVTKDAVNIIWGQATAANKNNAYLERKKIKAHNLKETTDGRLIAPIYNIYGEITSLQYISNDGKKKFQTGGEIKGGFNLLGTPGDKIFVAEGFATAATIYEVTGTPTIMAYSAGNIPEVVKLIRSRYGRISITIVADNDESKTGETYANKAAKLYGASVIIPPAIGDANDYYVNGGDLEGLLAPKEKWLTSLNDFIAKPKPIKWLIKHWIQDEALIMTFGQSGAGKTFVVLDWALRIATPSIDTWHGEKVRHGDIAYLAGEGHAGLRARCKAWIQENRKEDENIRFFISNSGTDMNTPEGLQKTIREIRESELKPRLIVIDTLHRFLDGDENNAQDTKTMLDACGVLTREFSCTVMLVHHTGVNPDAQKRGRGSSAWKGALEQEICVEKDGNTPYLTLTQTKNKDSEPAQPKSMELSTVTINGWLDEDGEAVTSAVVQECEKRAEKESPALQKMIDIFKRAWFFSGCETAENTPYLSRIAWQNFMVSNMGKTEGSARQMVKKSHKGGPAEKLINGKIIEEYLDGYRVINGALSTQLLLSKLL